MGSLTAQIWVGHPDQFHPGINPTHYLFLSENDRPAWMLVSDDLYNIIDKSTKKQIVWIPTLENMLEDAFLMIGIYILKDHDLIKIVKSIFNGIIPDRIELYSDIKEQTLKTLYNKNREVLKINKNLKIIITILKGSHIFNKLNVLRRYEVDIEVCKSKTIYNN